MNYAFAICACLISIKASLVVKKQHCVMELEEVPKMVLCRMTHKQVSEELQRHFPFSKGLSERSVRRFCKEHDMHKLRGPDLDVIVSDSVEEVSVLHIALLQFPLFSVHAEYRMHIGLDYLLGERERSRWLWLMDRTTVL